MVFCIEVFRVVLAKHEVWPSHVDWRRMCQKFFSKTKIWPRKCAVFRLALCHVHLGFLLLSWQLKWFNDEATWYMFWINFFSRTCIRFRGPISNYFEFVYEWSEVDENFLHFGQRLVKNIYTSTSICCPFTGMSTMLSNTLLFFKELVWPAVLAIICFHWRTRLRIQRRSCWFDMDWSSIEAQAKYHNGSSVGTSADSYRHLFQQLLTIVLFIFLNAETRCHCRTSHRKIINLRCQVTRLGIHFSSH